MLCLGGGGAATALILRTDGAESTVAAVGPEPTVEPVPSAGSEVKVVRPGTLGGRAAVRDGDWRAAVELLEERIFGPSDTSSVSGAYGKVGNVVLMAAAATSIGLPQQQVAGTLSSFGGSGVGVTGVVNASTGALGGHATCGNARVVGRKAAVCVWADEGSIGVVAFPARSAAAVVGEFPRLRAEIEKKG